MNPRSLRTGLAAVASLALILGAARAEEPANQALLDLLVRKGILTQEDVSSLRQELASQGPAEPGEASGQAAQGAAPTAAKAPSYFRIGMATFTPFGFMDLTGVYRSSSTGSSISTPFNTVPMPNSSAGQLSETKLSAQNSRLGLRIDYATDGTNVLGYVETDFLGNAPVNMGVSSNSATLRLRQYFLDLRRGPWEMLAGQGWTLLTPDRRSISTLPQDLFLTNDIDMTFQAGLTWARQPQVRFLYHDGDSLTYALSIESPDQYVGAAPTLPAAFPASEVDQGTSTTQPNALPDVIAKVAYDTDTVNDLPWHMELAGIGRTFRINTYASGVNADRTREAGGAEGAVQIGIVKNLSLVATGFYSYGGGRYINGLGPDFVVTAPDAGGAYGIGLIRAESSILGLEYAVLPSDTVSLYWSEVGFGRKFAVVEGSYVGYGYPGSPSADNRTIEELSLADTYTFWKSPERGALQVIGQVSRLERTPWYAAAGTPDHAASTMVFLDLRYILP